MFEIKKKIGQLLEEHKGCQFKHHTLRYKPTTSQVFLVCNEAAPLIDTRFGLFIRKIYPDELKAGLTATQYQEIMQKISRLKNELTECKKTG